MNEFTFTDQQITTAVEAQKAIHHDSARNEHAVCVRICAAWLEAQEVINRGAIGRLYPLKHIVESWGGRYVSTLDVMVAARLLKIRGKYPHLGINSRLVFPNPERLRGIGQAFTQSFYCIRACDHYQKTETGLAFLSEQRSYFELFMELTGNQDARILVGRGVTG